MTLVDAHCHLDFEAFDADRDEALDRAAAVGVRAIVIPGVHPAQWSRAATIVNRGHPNVRLAMAVGLHPEHLGSFDGWDDPGALTSRLVRAAEAHHAVNRKSVV